MSHPAEDLCLAGRGGFAGDGTGERQEGEDAEGWNGEPGAEMIEMGGDDTGEPGKCCSAEAGDREEKAELRVSACAREQKRDHERIEWCE